MIFVRLKIDFINGGDSICKEVIGKKDRQDGFLYYDASKGELVAWVKIPFLSSSEDTILYMYYGNSDCGNQQNAEGVWDENYLIVHHMTGSTYTELDDSTSNSWDVTSQNDNPSYNLDGKVGKCVDFDGSSDYERLDALIKGLLEK